MDFIVFASKLNQYGNKIEIMSLKHADNAWEMCEQLRIEGWTHNKIKQIKY